MLKQYYQDMISFIPWATVEPEQLMQILYLVFYSAAISSGEIHFDESHTLTNTDEDSSYVQRTPTSRNSLCVVIKKLDRASASVLELSSVENVLMLISVISVCFVCFTYISVLLKGHDIADLRHTPSPPIM